MTLNELAKINILVLLTRFILFGITSMYLVFFGGRDFSSDIYLLCNVVLIRPVFGALPLYYANVNLLYYSYRFIGDLAKQWRI